VPRSVGRGGAHAEDATKYVTNQPLSSHAPTRARYQVKGMPPHPTTAPRGFIHFIAQ